jgi:hypothetical protein
MRRFSFVLIISLLMAAGCQKENGEEPETVIPNKCAAELYCEDGIISVRILEASGSLDIDASIKVDFFLSGSTVFYLYDWKDGSIVFTQKTKKYSSTESFSPKTKLHVVKGNSVALIDVETLFKPIERHWDLSYSLDAAGNPKANEVDAIVETVDAVGTITFYRTREQVFKDQMKAVNSSDPTSSFSLTDPVECQMAVSLDKSMAFISSAKNPSQIVAFSAIINDVPCKVGN